MVQEKKRKSRLFEKQPKKWKKVTNIAVIIAVLGGTALGGSIGTEEGPAILWELPDKIKTILEPIVTLAAGIAGTSKFTISGEK